MELQSNERQLTWLDHIRLFNLIRTPRPGLQLAATTRDLARDVLDLAQVVDPHHIAPNVVTMRSRVRLVLAGSPDLELTLGYPDESGADRDRLSVFSPLGLQLLGAEEGDVIEWLGPRGEAHAAEVAEIIYQPESAGDFMR
jgi:regulator of nucleoside diphosphate kinase